MKKNKVIRKLYNALMDKGFSDNKYNEVMGYTRDKFNNPIYVKKLNIEGIPEVDSIAITSTEKDFEDACDSDIRIAFNDRSIGKRVILWANEVDTDMLNKILDAVINKYYNVSKVSHWKKLWDVIEKNYYDNDNKFVGNVEVPVNALAFILMDYKEYRNLEI